MTREEAINVITNADLSKVEDRVIKAIFYLCTNKALEQEPRWIPVSERLPKRENSEQLRGWYLTTNAYGSVGVTKYEFENGSFGFIGWGSDIRIVAWMPLPEPYKAESEDKDVFNT